MRYTLVSKDVWPDTWGVLGIHSIDSSNLLVGDIIVAPIPGEKTNVFKVVQRAWWNEQMYIWLIPYARLGRRTP